MHTDYSKFDLQMQAVTGTESNDFDMGDELKKMDSIQNLDENSH